MLPYILETAIVPTKMNPPQKTGQVQLHEQSNCSQNWKSQLDALNSGRIICTQSPRAPIRENNL